MCTNKLRFAGFAVGLLIWLSVGLSAEADSSESAQLTYSDRVSYESEGITLSGILWLPKSDGPHPAVVLVDGSGKTTAEGLKSWVDFYSKLGIACLTYNKRGVNDSGGEYLGGLKIDIPLLGKDVISGVNYLKTRKEIDASQIGLIGQSQAGWIIPVAAAQSEDVSYTIIISGPAVTLGEENYYSQLTGKDPFWGLVYWNLSRDEISRRLAERGPSMFDPMPYLKNMNVPGLWVYGELDSSQPTRESVVILDTLISEYDKEFTYKVFEGADHGLRVNGEPVEGLATMLENWLSGHVQLSKASTN